MTYSISGKWVDILNRKITEGTFRIENGRIHSFTACPVSEEHYILPGFIDAHIHIESSMLVPYEFARIALTHGTVATISDPHEIANVLGMEGVYYMLENAKDAKLKFHFGAPSCVPATGFESAGAVLSPADVDTLLQREDIYYLSEMMNYPGVINEDRDVLQKIAHAKATHKPVDGHAPGLRGDAVRKYISAGIHTDHECFTLDEAIEKISHGMKILIREGSAARNFDALHSLLGTHPASCMFCCDDKHPDELLLGHINLQVAKAAALGYDLFDILYAACIHPVMHYKIPVGILRPGDPADFIVIRNLADFKPEMTYINGELVAERGNCSLPEKKHRVLNNFTDISVTPASFEIKDEGRHIRVIEAYDGQLITGEHIAPVKSGRGLCL